MLTLRKLKEIVESPKKGEKKPSCRSLREGCPVVAQKIIQNEVGVVTITVYKNGYVVYQAQNRVTVFPIEDISGYRYSSVAGNGYGCDLTESYFEEAEWYLRFVLRGEDRLSINLRKHCTGHGGNDCSADDDRKHDEYADTKSERTCLCPLFRTPDLSGICRDSWYQFSSSQQQKKEGTCKT